MFFFRFLRRAFVFVFQATRIFVLRCCFVLVLLTHSFQSNKYAQPVSVLLTIFSTAYAAIQFPQVPFHCRKRTLLVFTIPPFFSDNL